LRKELYRVERNYGSFSRSFTLPAEVVVDKIAAEYKDGVLNVTLPKTEEAKVIEKTDRSKSKKLIYLTR